MESFEDIDSRINGVIEIYRMVAEDYINDCVEELLDVLAAIVPDGYIPPKYQITLKVVDEKNESES